MQTELLRKARDQEALNTGARNLIDNTEADHSNIHDLVDDVNTRWDQLNSGK